LRRVRYSLPTGPPTAVSEISLPWRAPIRFDPSDAIGEALLRTGVYELCVCEALYRLTDPGERAADAGANIGVMTSVLAARLGLGGAVFAFEPHPDVFEQLQENVDHWRADRSLATVLPRQLALSNRAGLAQLSAPPDFRRNRGTASLGGSAPGGENYEVECETLDSIFPAPESLGLLKLDVEGHEFEVLEGATRLLEEHRVRDIVFEEHASPPTPATTLLEGSGYAVFRLEQRLLGMAALPPMASSDPQAEPPLFVATADVARALSRLRPWGWSCLRSRRA
jgi:FkbM family methyltransferase